MVKKFIRVLPYLLCFVGTYYLMISLVSVLYEPGTQGYIERVKWISYGYGLTTLISFTGIGEAILRFQNGVRRMTKEESDFATPIFREVLRSARNKYPKLRTDVRLYVTNCEYINAYAIGKRTIVLTTEALYHCSPEEIMGLISHELGHIYHKHTRISLLMYVGNVGIIAMRVIAEIINLIFTICASIFGAFAGDAAYDLAHMTNTVIRFIVVTCIIGLWEKICGLLCNVSNRSFEYEADLFAKNIGYEAGLLSILQDAAYYDPQGLFSTIAFSHPKSAKRIERLTKKVYA